MKLFLSCFSPTTHIVSLLRLLVCPSNGHKRTLLVVQRLCGRGDRRDGVVVPTRGLCVDVIAPGRWRLGIWSPIIDLVVKCCVASVPVKSLRRVRSSWPTGSRKRAFIRRSPVDVLGLLFLLRTQPLLLFLQPRRTSGRGQERRELVDFIIHRLLAQSIQSPINHCVN